MRKYTGDPYKTTARFQSSCSSCKKTINKGDSIVYDKFRRLVYCLPGCGAEILQGVQAEKSMDQYGTDIF